MPTCGGGGDFISGESQTVATYCLPREAQKSETSVGLFCLDRSTRISGIETLNLKLHRNGLARHKYFGKGPEHQTNMDGIPESREQIEKVADGRSEVDACSSFASGRFAAARWRRARSAGGN